MRKQQNKIVEISSPLFQEGFFIGLQALQDETYNCAKCLTILKERKYNPNSPAFFDFVQGWKYSLE